MKADIIQQLGTNKFYRLRIGVGHPGNSKEVVDYVLKPPKKRNANKSIWLCKSKPNSTAAP